MPAAGFLVRIFIIQHDCGHGSFLKSRRANDTIGNICGLFTMTSYRLWRHQHAIHHAHHAELEERGIGDVWTMTVEEYRAAPGAEDWSSMVAAAVTGDREAANASQLRRNFADGAEPAVALLVRFQKTGGRDEILLQLAAVHAALHGAAVVVVARIATKRRQRIRREGNEPLHGQAAGHVFGKIQADGDRPEQTRSEPHFLAGHLQPPLQRVGRFRATLPQALLQVFNDGNVLIANNLESFLCFLLPLSFFRSNDVFDFILRDFPPCCKCND